MCGWYDEDISKIGQQVPESDRRISGKREAGGKPARSRHCKQKYTAIYVTDPIGKAVVCVAVSQETCQTVVRGMRYSRSRGLIVPNEDRYTQSSAFLRWIFLCEQRAKVRACTRPW